MAKIRNIVPFSFNGTQQTVYNEQLAVSSWQFAITAYFHPLTDNGFFSPLRVIGNGHQTSEE